MKIVSILFAAFMMLAFASCEKSGEKEQVAFEFVDSNGAASQLLTISSAAYSQGFSIKSNAAWQVERPQGDDWLTISPMKGEGDSPVMIEVKENEHSTLRQSELTFFANNKKVLSFIVKQEPAGDFLDVTPKMAEIPVGGGEVKLTVETNTGAWKYEIKGANSSWLREKSKDAMSVTFMAAKNSTMAELTATVEFTSLGQRALSQQVVISQPGMSNDSPDVLLNMVFANDGSATDASTMNNPVEAVAGSAMMTYYNDSYGRYVARFNHTPGSGISSGYYKMDYSSNTKFQKALADGHSLEVLFMYDSEPKAGAEVKMFSSMQSGGTGFLLASDSGEVAFLPNLGGWTWNRSGIVPQRGKYYHVVGVWDSEKHRALIYVNGELKGSVDALGNFKFPTPQSCNWFCVGGDAGPGTAESAWRGDVVLARIYNDPLPAGEVGKLWEQVRGKQPQNTIQLSDILFFANFDVKSGAKYRIAGRGFQSGDQVRLESMTDAGTTFTCQTTVTGNYLDAEIPTGFVAGKYRMLLKRGDASCPIGIATLTLADNPVGLVFPKVVAHRGFHTTNNASENSIAALAAAQRLGVYGSETDFYITKDGVVVCHHDTAVNGKTIESVDYAEIKDFTLSNGEKLPTLETTLAQLKVDSKVKLVLEIKSHSTDANNDRAVNAITEMIDRQGLAAQVDYIAFSYFVCRQLVKKVPAGTVVGYLSGNLAPSALDQGVNCIDYQMTVLRNNSQWIREAHARGMTVNVWTVNSQQDMMDFIAMGVDFITTDHPDVLKEIIARFSE